MAETATIPIERITASALKLLTHEQLQVLAYRLKDVDAVCAHALDLLEPVQLVEMATYIAYEAIKSKIITLILKTDDMEQGIIDFDIQGENQYLTIVCQQLMERQTDDNKETFTETKYHAVTALLSAAKIIAAERDDAKGKALLEEGVALNQMPANTQARAKATRDYFKKLFQHIDAPIKIY